MTGWGIYVVRTDPVLRYDQPGAAVLGAITSGHCCPSAPYAIAMVALGVAWFVVRD